jgi:uncharacterized membrane protein
MQADEQPATAAVDYPARQSVARLNERLNAQAARGASLRPRSPFAATLLLAGVSGARSMTGVAATSHALATKRAASAPLAPEPARLLSEPRIAKLAAVAAAAEIVGDKLPSVPDRIAPGPLVGRALSGAVVAAAIAADSRQDRRAAAILGALTAVACAHLSFHARRRLSEIVEPTLAAVIEDIVVLSIASIGVAALAPDR